MSTYTKAPEDVCSHAQAVMGRYHGPMHEVGVTVKVLMAHPPVDKNDDATGPAISVGGYPALAKIRVLSLKDRVAYGFDTEMVLDADHWDECSDEERDAIIDHELSHLELKLKEGALVRDDSGRPCLRIVKHDYQFGWFADVARRHGEASIEIQQARKMLEGDTWIQCFLPGMQLEEVAA